MFSYRSLEQSPEGQYRLQSLSKQQMFEGHMLDSICTKTDFGIQEEIVVQILFWKKNGE